MQVIESINEMQALSVSLRIQGKLIGFVPTMGCLHEGHLRLMDIAREQADILVVSIFVNPAQFGPSEDFDRYPKSRESDLKGCEKHGVDYVFIPESAEFYPQDFSTYIVEDRLSTDLCGISRPNFFRGVCTVVAKLFNIVRPDIAVFGQKDAQQAAVIKRMVRDLYFPIDIIIGPTIREKDGLAMSSRNAYLTKAQREAARSIYKSLSTGEKMINKGVKNVDRIRAEIIHHLSLARKIRVIYVAIVNRETIEPVREIEKGRTLIALAVWVDEIRLIDNLVV